MFKKPRMPDQNIRMILSFLGERRKWIDIKSDAGCHGETITSIKKWFNSLSWREAKVYAEGNENVLKARTNYLADKAGDR